MAPYYSVLAAWYEIGRKSPANGDENSQLNSPSAVPAAFAKACPYDRLLFAASTLIWFWLDSMRCREIATGIRNSLCEREGVQFLDHRLPLAKLGLNWGPGVCACVSHIGSTSAKMAWVAVLVSSS